MFSFMSKPKFNIIATINISSACAFTFGPVHIFGLRRKSSKDSTRLIKFDEYCFLEMEEFDLYNHMLKAVYYSLKAKFRCCSSKDTNSTI